MHTPSLDILHMVGFLTGAALYGMLLAFVTRTPARPDPFALATALLGLTWNVGELGWYAGRAVGVFGEATWLRALDYSALGWLAAVVVLSAARQPDRGGRGYTAPVVYGGAALAAILHVRAAVAGDAVPSATGLIWLTVSLVVAAGLIVLSSRRQPHRQRALWLATLAVFAVSVLHLGRLHGTQESWPIEVVGHHASMLLAFALLYQDFRFAFADLFLKQALTLLALVAVVGSGYASVSPWLREVDGAMPPAATGLLLALWAITVLVFPVLRRGVTTFVDRAVLRRQDYGRLVASLASDLQRFDTAEDVLDYTATVVATALTASGVSWHEPTGDGAADGAVRLVSVETADAPGYVLAVGVLDGGRRLLSDDVAMLDRVALEAARRIDAVRLTEERYERMLQEREMRSLASEAELRALRAQINPHFLFNALTTITYLIEHAPVRARSALLRLTTLLRSVLRSDGAFTTLGRERELIECYLQIEHERFEERLGYVIDIPDALADLPIPSLVVQPLVENAIKHGISSAADGGLVSVSAHVGADLAIVVRNTGTPLGASTSAPGFGVGLRNVEQRLRHHYGSAAHVVLRSAEDGSTVAELHLPRPTLVDEAPTPAVRRADR